MAAASRRAWIGRIRRVARCLGAAPGSSCGGSNETLIGAADLYGHEIDGLTDVDISATVLKPQPLRPEEDPVGASGVALTQQEIDHFKSQGFLIKRGLLNAKELRPFADQTWAKVPSCIVRDEPSSWEDAGSRWPCNNLYHAHGGTCLYPPDENCGGRMWWDVAQAPGFLDVTTRSTPMISVVESLIGGPVKLPGRCRGMYTIWPRGPRQHAAEGTLGPHIDTETEQLLAVFYLDSVGPKEGGFVVWPQSHAIMYHGFEEEINPVLRPERYNELMAEVRGSIVPREFVGSAGDVIFIHNRMVHSSGQNFGSTIRMAAIQDYQRIRPKSQLKYGTPEKPSGMVPWQRPDGSLALEGRAAPGPDVLASLQFHHDVLEFAPCAPIQSDDMWSQWNLGRAPVTGVAQGEQPWWQKYGVSESEQPCGSVAVHRPLRELVELSCDGGVWQWR